MNPPHLAVAYGNAADSQIASKLQHDSVAPLQLSLPLRRYKRFMDLVLSFFLLLLVSPVMFAIMLFVWCEGGSPIFGHRRVGKGGDPFTCWKFRTMKPGSYDVLEQYLAKNETARAEWEAYHKLKYDPRVTWLGRWLRRTSLDELPQLFNVLMGDMSLVGPRPIVWHEVPKYAKDIAYYYAVKPGITGLWQVSGRNSVGYNKRVALDREYALCGSIWLDIGILLRTAPALMRQGGV